MAERKSITYTFERYEDWQESLESTNNIVKEDTGAEFWKSTRSMPPKCFPPPMTQEAIAKLKEVKGLVVEDLPEES
ncbi:succinyl-:3-ketoacid-coenzyme a mitochondrial precursor [Fusarium heterosporum]|uniref:Succinyl-:3-ketoacid-coenzyme a mitochondrial n=1 Tax=Fusarium heterosporum TaxID=42747 RepID=A0A8H5WR60_FUSHE|nr:succinyl-:3-ketoacid-coenzyme a mitochondrial precursor [Fusarium heterosporum]